MTMHTPTDSSAASGRPERIASENDRDSADATAANAESDQTNGNAMPESVAALGGQVRRAVFWRTGSQIVSQAISWSATLIVIRLLNPEDYGLFAMAQVMMTFLDFLNGYGFASALIQSKEVSKQAIRQALGLLVIMNSGMAALQYMLASSVAAYYGKPQVAELLHALCFIYLTTPFIIVSEVLLSRSLDFKRLAIANLTAAAVGAAVSLTCALNGLGVWTLVYAPMSLFLTRAICLTIAARLFTLPSFDFRGAGAIVKFGGALMVGHLFWVIQSQADVFIAGRLFSAHDVGLYSEALFLTQLVMAKFIPPLNQVAFPAYARLQDDPAAVRWSFLSAMQMVLFVAAPIFIGIAASAEPLIAVLFGAKWLEMAPLMQVIGLAMPLMTVQILFAPVNNAFGRPDVTMRVSACGALIFAAAFLIGALGDGIEGMAYAWLLAAPLLLVATILIAGPVSGVTMGAVARAALPGIGCALAMGAIVHGIDMVMGETLPPVPHLILLIALGAATYALLSWHIQRPAIDRLRGLLFNRQKAHTEEIAG